MEIIRKYLVLVLLFASLALYSFAWRFGVKLEFAVMASSVLTLVLAWTLERRLPYRKEWSVNRGDLSVDIASTGVIIGLIDPLLKVVSPLVVVMLYATLNMSPIIADLSLWFQVLLVMLLVELGKYWSHRVHHQSKPMWWLHAMHHSSERLYFLNGLRFHPLNYALNFLIAVLPVMILGASPEAILGYLAISQPVVLLQHANIDLRHGWLNWVFSTPEAHRWHHSTNAPEADRNFGSALLIWDHVFGTFKRAEGFEETKLVGLFSSSKKTYPGDSGYISQLTSMFKPSCCGV